MKIRHFLLGRKAITNLDNVLKSRDITLPTNICLVKAIIFSSSHVWTWKLGYKESWALKNWCFQIVVWKRLLRVPWTAKRSNQSILKEISPEYSLEVLMLKLKLQYFGHQMWRADVWNKSLILGKTEGRRRRERQRMRWLDGYDWVDMNLNKPWVIVEDTRDWCAAVQEVATFRDDLATQYHHHQFQ